MNNTNTNKNDNLVKKISKIILINEKKMIRERDLIEMCSNLENFNDIIKKVHNNLKNIGFELVKTSYLEEKYYILTTEGKEKALSPIHYGILAIIIALNNEIGENLNYFELKNILKDVWENVEYLIKNNYLAQIKSRDYHLIKITPIGKGVLKNIISEINLKKILELFEKTN
ncbi:MAG: hypothetical protein KAX10_06235 [Candidatus Lokiarchaeota archaeon]|nr:hypothetical protein [Candidatus Lokiarchaeota archaeon]